MTVGDVELFYTDDGSQRVPMLFVHGTACDSHDWSWQLAHFGETHRVIAVDLRGHGRSSAPADGYDAAALAADVAGLLRRLGCGPVVAVGHSLGGIVVSLLAAEHPEMVSAVVGADPAYLVPDDRIDMLTTTMAAVDADPVAAMQQLFRQMHGASSAGFLTAWHCRRAAGVPAHVLRQTMANYRWSLESAALGYLRRRTCPVLTVFADGTRVEAESAVFSDSRSRAVSWDGSGHWLHQERPSEFNSLVDDWLSGLGLNGV